MEQVSYARQWRDLRFRSRLLLLLILLYIPSMVLAVRLLDRVSQGLGDQYADWLFGGWALLVVVVSFHQISFRCPQCGGWFGSSDGWTNPFARKCLHCGLSRNGDLVPDMSRPH